MAQTGNWRYGNVLSAAAVLYGYPINVYLPYQKTITIENQCNTTNMLQFNIGFIFDNHYVSLEVDESNVCFDKNGAPLNQSMKGSYDSVESNVDNITNSCIAKEPLCCPSDLSNEPLHIQAQNLPQHIRTVNGRSFSND